MAADREQALRHGEVAIAERALGDRLVRQMRLEFAPERDPFEQRAGQVEPRLAERQRRVHVEVAVDEGRRQETAARVDRLARLGFEPRLDRGDAAGGDRDVLPLRPSGSVALRMTRSKANGAPSPLNRADAARAALSIGRARIAVRGEANDEHGEREDQRRARQNEDARSAPDCSWT